MTSSRPHVRLEFPSGYMVFGKSPVNQCWYLRFNGTGIATEFEWRYYETVDIVNQYPGCTLVNETRTFGEWSGGAPDCQDDWYYWRSG